jgi:hypothetical protein
MDDADIISHVRNLRRLVSTLDSIGFPVEEIINDPEFIKMFSKKLPDSINKVSSNIHLLVKRIEKSKRYKEAVKNLCGVKVRD